MSEPNVMYDHFYTYAELASWLAALQAAQPALVSVASLATTAEGRSVHVVTVTDPATGPAADKPAYFVQAGLHAQEGAGTTAACHFLYRLLTDPACAPLLRKLAFYVVPRINPDGTEFALTKRTRVRSRFEQTETKNGLQPADLNGDGLILSMRWEDPAGPMVVDPEEPRLMVRRQPGDAGPFYQVTTEGLVHDYDGGPIVDGTRLIDFNRNWPTHWETGHNGSRYPFAEPEVRAVGEFLLAHPNIFAGVDFHCGTHAIFKPCTVAESTLPPADLELMVRVGKRAEQLTGFPLMHQGLDYKEPWRPPHQLHGIATDWTYQALGLSQYLIELGNGFNNAGISPREYFAADAREREGAMMRRVLAFHDRQGSRLFVPWTACDHPQLGPVEVGGILNGCGYWMWPPVMAEIAPRTTAFLLEHAGLHPELTIVKAVATALGGGVFRVRATVANVGGFSTRVMEGGGSEAQLPPVRVRLAPGDGVRVVSRQTTLEVGHLAAGGGSAACEWFVVADAAPGRGTVTLEARHPRGGVARTALALDPTALREGD